MMRDRKEKAKVSTGSQGFQGLLYIVVHIQRFSHNTRSEGKAATLMTVALPHTHALEGALIFKVKTELFVSGCPVFQSVIGMKKVRARQIPR